MDNTARSFCQRADILVVNSERWWSWRNVGRSYRMHWGKRFYFRLGSKNELLSTHGISQRPEGSRQLAMQRYKRWGRARAGWQGMEEPECTMTHKKSPDLTTRQLLGDPQERNSIGCNRKGWITVVLLDQSFSNLDCQHFKTILYCRWGVVILYSLECFAISLTSYY